MTHEALDHGHEKYSAAIETALREHLPKSSDLAPKLVAALGYVCLGGGKRLRPSLVCATCESLGGTLDSALQPAVAIEYMHCYSLVHDDLPAMDDDGLRRGRATCHIAFDEATAILAGDALQTLAFEVLAKASQITPTTRLGMIRMLACAAGWQGMVGGQSLDIVSASGPRLALDKIEHMHAAKTGALFKLSVQLGALASGQRIDDETFRQLTTFGEQIGIAFQIVDDILDVTQPSEVIGKDAGSDVTSQKNTYVTRIGLNQARAMALSKLEEALTNLEILGLRGGPLEDIACATVNRVS
jgi:geranylgeranyl pyrophosphate synthase